MIEVMQDGGVFYISYDGDEFSESIAWDFVVPDGDMAKAKAARVWAETRLNEMFGANKWKWMEV